MSIEYIRSTGKYASGLSLGIMLCESTYPGFPGDVKNPSAYNFPIQYEVIENMRWETLVYGSSDQRDKALEAIINAAKKLEKMGCKAILAECGYFLFYQEEIVKHVNIPVFMSSLLQIPFIQNTISKDKSIGIVCASRKTLTENMDYLYKLGLNKDTDIKIYGVAEDYPCYQFNSLWDRENSDLVSEAYFLKAQEDMINFCKQFVNKYQNIGTLVFECTGFQPFANAVQRELRIPIYSWGTLMEYVNSAVVHRAYDGHI